MRSVSLCYNYTLLSISYACKSFFFLSFCFSSFFLSLSLFRLFSLLINYVTIYYFICIHLSVFYVFIFVFQYVMIYRDYRIKKKEVVRRNTETMIHQHLEELVLEKERLKNEFKLVCEVVQTFR